MYWLKTAFAIFFCFICVSFCQAQYYLKGEVVDDSDNPLSNVHILLQSSGYVYYSGSSGGFGIMSNVRADSATFSMEGFQSVKVQLAADQFKKIRLSSLFEKPAPPRIRLMSITKNLTMDERNTWTVGRETYSSLLENEFVSATRYPETGFAIHTDKASYSNIRRFLNMDMQVPPDAVRTEEMLNYFDLGTASTPRDSVFGFSSYYSDCPWDKAKRLLFLSLAARKIDPANIPPSNLVFLVDVSGSMDMPNRLPLLKSGFKLLVNNLRAQDTISIVVYGSATGVWLPPTSGKEKEKIRKAIEDLYPAGATPGESGILTAYRLAKSQFIPHGNNRVILATDGDFNVGQTSDDDLENLITAHQKSGIYLTCLGVGMGNYKDSKLEVLAKKGNGNFAYLDNEHEAEKILVKEFTQTLYTVADDVFLNVAFNPHYVNEYRLIGYENKVKALSDSTSTMEGGEVGSGHSTVAIFEIDPAAGAPPQPASANLAQVTISYRLPDTGTVEHTITHNCSPVFTEVSQLPAGCRFATSVALFASLLKDSKFTRNMSWNDVLSLAQASSDPANAVQQEFIEMVEKAKKLYSHRRRKK